MGSAELSTPTMRPWLPFLLLTASPAAAQTKTIVLSSDGPAAEWRGGNLGVYDRLHGLTNGCPAYKQRHTVGGKVNYLYREADKDWRSGYELGGYKSGLKNEARQDNCAVPSTGWQYGHDGTWQPTSSLSISTPSKIRSCSRVKISGNWRIRSGRATIGCFLRTSAWSAGRPVYKNRASGWVLLVPSGKTLWGVKATAKSKYKNEKGYHIKSGSAPSLNPADRRAAVSARYGLTNWADWNGGKWKQDGNISVQCFNSRLYSC